MMNIQLGYQLNNSLEEEKKALQHAFDLVRKSQHLALAMRTWAKQTNMNGQILLKDYEKKNRLSDREYLTGINAMEMEILSKLKNYMSDVSELINGLKPLNPPLRTDQIRPFVDAVKSDRNITVEALSPLTQTVTALTTIKKRLSDPDNPNV